MNAKMQRELVDNVYDKINALTYDQASSYWPKSWRWATQAVTEQVNTAVEDRVYISAMLLLQHTHASSVWRKGMSL